MDINKILAAGRLTKEPEISRKNEKTVARYTLAVNSGETTDFIPCVAFGRQAELAEQYLHQGRELLVFGRLQIKREEESGRILYAKILVSEQHFGKNKGTYFHSQEKGYVPDNIKGEMLFQ